ncbi:hypothetical protein KR026_004078 [Drosophila bipectinata]|nr:hypothetical protein KR026_004078 [Drosophila bipectinata]
MASLVEWCLYICYKYGRFTGVINFEYDMKARRARATKRTTVWAAVSHSTMFLMLLLQIVKRQTIGSIWTGASTMTAYVFMAIALVRMCCVFLAVVSRWCNRQRFMKLFNAYMNLSLVHPEIIQYCRRSIVSKFFTALMAETLQMVVVLLVLRRRLTLTMAVGIWSIMSLMAIINVIVTQFFIALAHIRGRYCLLNKELRAVVSEVQSLVPNRKGVHMIRCCVLADRLEEIAQTHSELQALTEELSKTYQVQILCMIVTYYMTMVGNVYLLFSLNKYGALTGLFNIYIGGLGVMYLVFYYLDCSLNGLNVMYLLDAHAEMVRLLQQRTNFQPGLDQRLETVVSRFLRRKPYNTPHMSSFQFESFTLNLARNPFKLRVFGMFEMDYASSFALGGSMLTHSILLIQYDIENS